MELQLKQYELGFKERESQGKILQYWGNTVKLLADAEAAEAGSQLELYKQHVSAYQARLGYLGKIQTAAMKPKGGESDA